MSPEGDPGDSMRNAVEVNRAFYESHGSSAWKARFMYDPVSKRNVALDCLRRAGAWPVGRRVLDIGFGFGLTLFALDRSNRLTGVEIAASAVEYARGKARRLGFADARFVQYSGTGRLPLGDAEYDLIVCSHVLEHVPDDRFLLAEIARLLAPGGRALLNVPINEDRFDDPNHARKYTPEGFLALVRSFGFRPLRVCEADRLWDWFGWFFERGYHELPVVGFPLSSAINVLASSLPYGLACRLERALRNARPRQYVVLAARDAVAAGAG
jgi:SAM-dependent methyltransferase